MVKNIVDAMQKDSIVINGGAPGADSYGASYARLAGLEVETYATDLGMCGNRAGFIRNTQMLEDGKPDVVYAFVDKPIAESKGTAMVVKIAQDAGVPVIVLTQTTKVVHLKRKPFDVRIDRRTPWGNPFVQGPDGSREVVVDLYDKWLSTDDPQAVWISQNVHSLSGKTLGCWCAPQLCHGDVLAARADGWT